MKRLLLLYCGVALGVVLMAVSCSEVVANVNYVETAMAPGVTEFGTDVEGLLNAVFTLDFTTDSGVYVAVGSYPSAPSSSANVSISGSTIPANNGTFTVVGSAALGVDGTMVASPSAAGNSVAFDTTLFEAALAVLPSGNLVNFPISRYPIIATPSLGDVVSPAHFSTASATLAGQASVFSPAGSLLWRSTQVISPSRQVVPEPGGFLPAGIVALSLATSRRRA